MKFFPFYSKIQANYSSIVVSPRWDWQYSWHMSWAKLWAFFLVHFWYRYYDNVFGFSEQRNCNLGTCKYVQQSYATKTYHCFFLNVVGVSFITTPCILLLFCTICNILLRRPNTLIDCYSFVVVFVAYLSNFVHNVCMWWMRIVYYTKWN